MLFKSVRVHQLTPRLGTHCLIDFSGKVLTVGALNSNLVFLCNETMPKSGIYHGKLELTEILN